MKISAHPEDGPVDYEPTWREETTGYINELRAAIASQEARLQKLTARADTAERRYLHIEQDVAELMVRTTR